MSNPIRRYEIGYGRFLADRAGYFQQCIEQNEKKIKRYEKFIKKLRAKNDRLRVLKKNVEEGRIKQPNLEESVKSFHRAVMD